MDWGTSRLRHSAYFFAFGHRKGRIGFDLASQLNLLGYLALERSDAEFHEICRDCDSFKLAVKRRVRQFVRLIAEGPECVDRRGANAFRILRRWSRQTLRHLEHPEG